MEGGSGTESPVLLDDNLKAAKRVWIDGEMRDKFSRYCTHLWSGRCLSISESAALQTLKAYDNNHVHVNNNSVHVPASLECANLPFTAA